MLTALIITVCLVAADQITKIIVRSNMAVGETAKLIPGFIRLRHIENDGASFGILSDARWVFMTLSVVAIIFIIIFLYKFHKRHKLLTVSLAVILSGGIGNMVDRIFNINSEGFRVVTDFFEFEFVDFAIFNVADICITVGAVLLAVYVLFFEKKVDQKITAEAAVEEDTEITVSDDGNLSDLSGNNGGDVENENEENHCG